MKRYLVLLFFLPLVLMSELSIGGQVPQKLKFNSVKTGKFSCGNINYVPDKKIYNQFVQLAQLNEPAAQLSLGFAYLGSSNTPEDKRNKQQGLKWIEKAAMQGDTVALIVLSDFYFNGECVEKNINIAKTYLELAEQSTKAQISVGEALLEKIRKKQKLIGGK